MDVLRTASEGTCSGAQIGEFGANTSTTNFFVVSYRADNHNCDDLAEESRTTSKALTVAKRRRAGARGYLNQMERALEAALEKENKAKKTVAAARERVRKAEAKLAELETGVVEADAVFKAASKKFLACRKQKH